MATPRRGYAVRGNRVEAEIVGLAEFQRDLRRLGPEVLRALRVRLRAAAGVVVADARARADWSRRIPGAISASVANRGVGIRVAATRAPHGPRFELGSAGSPRVVRHPLFGDRRHWFETPVRRFLAPAIDARRADVFRQTEAAVDDAAREVGFR